MNETKPLTDAELEKADEEAVMQHFLHGTPLEPDVSVRVRARAAKITEHLRATHGVIDDETWQKIIGDDDDEQ
jgi:hypothetical protein